MKPFPRFLPLIFWMAALPFSGAQPAYTISALEAGESALRDGIPSLALRASGEISGNAATDAVSAEAAFTLRAAAQEQLLSPRKMLDWLNAATNAPAQPALYYRARALSELGRTAEAVPLLEELRASLPKDSPLAEAALRDHAYALAASGNTARAAEVLSKATDQNISHTLDLASLLLSTGHALRAIDLLTPHVTATNAPATAAPAALLLARALNDSGSRAEDALALLSSIPTEDDQIQPDVRALTAASMAVLSARQEIYPTALKQIEQAISLAVSPAVRLDCEGTRLRILVRSGAPDEALALARSLVVSAPRSGIVSRAVLDAVEICLEKDLPRRAIDFADLFIASFLDSPGESRAHALRALAYAQLEQFAEASTSYLRAAEMAQNKKETQAYVKNLYAAAEAQFNAGFLQQASRTLERLLAENPPPTLIRSATYLQAEILSRLDTGASITAFLQFVEQNPQAPEAAAALYRAAQLTALASEQTSSDDSAGSTAALKEAIRLFQQASTNALARAQVSDVLRSVSSETPAKTSGVPDPPSPETPGPRSEIEEANAIQASSALAAALLQQRLGDYKNALASLELVLSTPRAGRVVEQAASLRPSFLLALGRDQEAIAAYDLFVASYPQSEWMRDAVFWRASRAFNTQDYNTAAAIFSSYASRWPDASNTDWALYFTAVSYFRSAHFSQTVETALLLETKFPGSPTLVPTRFVHAEASCQLLAFDEAALLFSAIEKDSSAPPETALRATIRRGDCLFTLSGEQKERCAESIEAYSAALRNPLCATLGYTLECQYKIARSCERLSESATALDLYYRNVILPFEAAPAKTDAVWYARSLYAAADILRSREDWKGANQLLKRLAESDLPGAAEAKRRMQ